MIPTDKVSPKSKTTWNAFWDPHSPNYMIKGKPWAFTEIAPSPFLCFLETIKFLALCHRCIPNGQTWPSNQNVIFSHFSYAQPFSQPYKGWCPQSDFLHKATERLGVQIPALLYICFVTSNEFNIFLPQFPYLGYDDNNSTIILRLGARIELMPVEAGLRKLPADVVCLLFLLSIPSSVLPAEAPGKLLERKAWRSRWAR